MKEPRQAFLTTGQIAKRTGLTLRTLRYYDAIGLLKPAHHDDTAARLYSREDLIRLQRIQTLKYIGLSLAEIAQILSRDTLPEQDLRASLRMQKELMRKKMAHMQYVTKAIDEALTMLEGGEQEVGWDELTAMIQTVHTEKDWGEQYRSAARLQARMALYDRYSANGTGWHRWFFSRLPEEGGLKVLELGCGDGALWERSRERIPQDWSVTLTDLSPGMLEEARSRLAGVPGRFRFLAADAEEIPFHDGEFDIVIANHMLYHVMDIPRAAAEMHRVLKPGGRLYASTMSLRHLREVEELAKAFDPQIEVLDPVLERFHLENGAAHLSPPFRTVECIRYDDHLLVDEAEPLIAYITSTPMNAKERLVGEALQRFRSELKARLEREGSLYITKDTGFFLAVKS
ncbi:MerR family transcriptional regulator [Paenibacillus mucilaginosus]|uniref:MerR family transcriptional regulator n=2 Tax=Paenibacillus mucilaginosus TaxID=61624 RepID=H6NTR9_9BACL|nr:methyltransferase domain-containing protein [Paenibacillus mucilaginosus]AEI39392.1 transcriptional regulator, MerR family [Paenibacillus mucilaginosus KNP414]AFC27663.1 MerR family transcriptional regulator [Paenibacillus mucilaginosus 3016]MCG7214767.1 methyltransferase domain-containing protein [Paenibacillus mucilaginosus]WDM28376.1 methyltransferase domain-containing protein [Paenibacillus mucilaginosus]WFA16548.1 methyltransferase domain-containing protein [Paenibacillus mucilaginosus